MANVRDRIRRLEGQVDGLAVGVTGLATEHKPIPLPRNQVGQSGSPERPDQGQIIDGFEQVGLALAVPAHKTVHAGMKINPA